jgi:diacylglycerol kinase (ATP)
MRVILNPEARNGGGRRLRATIERELDRRRIPFDLVETEGPWHARDLAAEAAGAGVHRIVAAGGDGTVHEVANGIISAGVNGVALGAIPIGTGNDFVKTLPGAGRRDHAFAALQDGVVHAVDLGCVRWDGHTEYFINAMGTGIDVEVVRGLRRSRFLPGGASYVRALLRALVRYRPLPVELEVDGETTHQSIMILAVCNGPSIGGAFRICPDAIPTDDLFDICLIGELPVLRNVRLVPRVLSGTHAGHRGVTMLRGRHIRLRTRDQRPLAFQLDGELREMADGAAGVSVDIAPLRLNVIGGRVPMNGSAPGSK